MGSRIFEHHVPAEDALVVERAKAAGAVGTAPANARVERYIPLSLLFPRCALAITPGGSGTVMAALGTGVPLVVMPVGADHPQNGARCAVLGVGRVVDAEPFDPQALREAVRDVLSSAAYRRNASRMAAEIAALPGPGHAVGLLERLVTTRAPVRTGTTPRPDRAGPARPKATRRRPLGSLLLAGPLWMGLLGSEEASVSTEENKAVTRRDLEEVWNQGNVAAMDELHDPGCLFRASDGTTRTVAEMKQIVGAYRAAFPDLRFTLEQLVAEGDWVVLRYTGRGTHRGSLMGVAPTGRQVTFAGVDFHRVVGGRVVENWYILDRLSLMQQLGVVPAPGPAKA